MFGQIGADLVERAGRDLGAVAQSRHQLAVVDDEAAEGGFGRVRGAAKIPDFTENLVGGSGAAPVFASLNPHGCSPAVASLSSDQGTTAGKRQPQTEWAGFMGACPHFVWGSVSRAPAIAAGGCRAASPDGPRTPAFSTASPNG